MQLTFLGAAREVTGSCHLLEVNGHAVMLDCGMFQGKRSDSSEKNRTIPHPVAQIDAVVLSHAHIDHAGRLPFLAKLGYDKTIFCTPATRDLTAIMLADSAHIQEKDAQYLNRRNETPVPPLYTLRDAARVQELMVAIPYHKPFDVVPGVRATYFDAGHILGSASVLLECTENGVTKCVLFSADIGRWGLPIIRDPEMPGGADVVIMESTYGNRDHESVDGARERLARVIRETAAKGGRIMIPAFAVGRTQEIVYDLHVLARSGEIPAIPIFVDSPLAIDATTIFAQHPEVFDQSEDLIQRVEHLFHHGQVRYTRKPEESKALNQMNGPIIVIAASGMAETGRIVHHLKNGAANPNNTILIVGFQAEHTTGRRIVEKRPVIKVLGEGVELRARVEVINGYSAHADRTELKRWLDGVKSESPNLTDVHLVHGEPEAQDALAESLNSSGYRVNSPARGSRVSF
ncbi:MAG: MBL fold metallo-hydrolase [Gemmatimonadota bacterium]|nr:MBL fold metallo-hydrolase [Gemmatimonadota bacterium]